MLRAKRGFKRKHGSKAVSVLGATSLSLSLASGASAATDVAGAGPLNRNSLVGHEVLLCEEEISDVSLATFYVFENEHAATVPPRVRLAMAGCGCPCGIGCGELPTSTDYGASTFRSYANPPSYSIRPARKYAHTPKRKIHKKFATC